MCHCSQGLNFSGADLSRLDLRYINFKMANLSRCNLTHANLCCSNLERADLSGANLDVSLFLSCDGISRRADGALAVWPRGSEHFLLLSVSFLYYVEVLLENNGLLVCGHLSPAALSAVWKREAFCSPSSSIW